MSVKEVKKIGLVGGGMGSFMFCIEAQKLGLTVCLLDPKLDCIASRVATEHIVGSITNENLKKLSLRCDKILYNTTADFEIATKLHAEIVPSVQMINELYDFKNILEIVELAEIPMGHIISEENNKDAFKDLTGLKMPFRFIKRYKNYSKQASIRTEKDLTDFVMQKDEDAESFILQSLDEYVQIASCICIVDDTGKLYQYQPIKETTEDNTVYKLSMGDDFTKNMINKMARYNRKLFKEIKSSGIFTIKYGIKANKGIEFIEITPQVGLGSLLTMYTYKTSVFEQLMRVLLGKELTTPCQVDKAYGIVTPHLEKQHIEETKNKYEMQIHQTCDHFYQCQTVDLAISYYTEV